jgi:hypothetical protein
MKLMSITSKVLKEELHLYQNTKFNSKTIYTFGAAA